VVRGSNPGVLLLPENDVIIPAIIAIYHNQHKYGRVASVKSNYCSEPATKQLPWHLDA